MPSVSVVLDEETWNLWKHLADPSCLTNLYNPLDGRELVLAGSYLPRNRVPLRVAVHAKDPSRVDPVRTSILLVEDTVRFDCETLPSALVRQVMKLMALDGPPQNDQDRFLLPPQEQQNVSGNLPSSNDLGKGNSERLVRTLRERVRLSHEAVWRQLYQRLFWLADQSVSVFRERETKVPLDEETLLGQSSNLGAWVVPQSSLIYVASRAKEEGMDVSQNGDGLLRISWA